MPGLETGGNAVPIRWPQVLVEACGLLFGAFARGCDGDIGGGKTSRKLWMQQRAIARSAPIRAILGDEYTIRQSAAALLG